ncbi:guanosine-3',5'-bis 3'-pyrophosphohydrolase MESH1-like protein [Meredithblackwellia eburnea MCA 4105]
MSDSLKVLQAATFAAQKHTEQRRKNKAQTPYINHPIIVSTLIAESGVPVSVETLQAAILHDTVEDTDTTLEEVEKVFGKTVRDLVDQVSDDKTLPKLARKQAQIEHAPHVSESAKHIKLADKLANLTDLTTDVPVGWTVERVQEYFEWAKKVTDGCKSANPPLAAKLDLLYKEATFKHPDFADRTFKCHKTYTG